MYHLEQPWCSGEGLGPALAPCARLCRLPMGDFDLEDVGIGGGLGWRAGGWEEGGGGFCGSVGGM